MPTSAHSDDSDFLRTLVLFTGDDFFKSLTQNLAAMKTQYAFVAIFIA